MIPINTRTDIASEAHALWRSSAGATTKLNGVIARDEILDGFSVTNVDIIDERGAAALGKPCGHYSTLRFDSLSDRPDAAFRNAVCTLSKTAARCLPDGAHRFLIAALGNPDITPDALGPLAAENIIVTRHLKHQLPDAFASMSDVAVCRTGVLGMTGVESSLLISSLCRELRPDCVIAIDARAGSDVETLCKCVQICDTGISPGSGVGNDRAAIDKATLGVPVVAVGVPTVIDASAYGDDESLEGMFVTPRYIDSAVRTAAKFIAYALNMAMHRGISFEEVTELAG